MNRSTTEELQRELLRLRGMHTKEIGGRAGEVALLIEEILESRAAGASHLLSLANELEKEAERFTHENCAQDPKTGVREGIRGAEEWISDREELIEEIRARAKTLHPEGK